MELAGTDHPAADQAQAYLDAKANYEQAYEGFLAGTISYAELSWAADEMTYAANHFDMAYVAAGGVIDRGDVGTPQVGGDDSETQPGTPQMGP